MRDDFFRHRLAVAARCVGEIPPEDQPSEVAVIDQVTSTALSFWWKHERRGTGAAIAHLSKVLPAMGQLGSAAATAPVLVALVERLAHPERSVRSSAAAALGKLHEEGVRIFPRRRRFLLFGPRRWQVSSVAALADVTGDSTTL